jgi:hypothetical protein
MLALRAFLLVLFVLLFSGCGLDAREVGAPALPSGSPVVQSDSQTSATIGSGGGSLSTGGVTLTIPALALSQATTVGLAVTESNGSYSIEVTPPGQILSRPATIAVPCSSGGCELLWLNPDTQQWENITTSTSPGYVYGRPIQFSELNTDVND